MHDYHQIMVFLHVQTYIREYKIHISCSRYAAAVFCSLQEEQDCKEFLGTRAIKKFYRFCISNCACDYLYPRTLIVDNHERI